ncbi:hypothetical protein [Actinoplanes aureus]|uniref:Uncharacterized protein n=1 Tax=Actinoplanes aureus TaxID=2792083 RepID=A0A931G3B2_9ACTN|nr:hypothetical protein [Actinoplanes aureus]MBG0568662.1 hypothetical protein [Actinoplanes aureus]
MADQLSPRNAADEGRTGRIRLPSQAAIPGRPAATALRDALRWLVRDSAFATLEELGSAMPRVMGRRRLSELLSGHQLPDTHDVDGLVSRCAPKRRAEILGLLRAAHAEDSAARTRPEWDLSALVRQTSADGQRLPLVKEITDWQRFGVHHPIAVLASGQDLSERTAAGVLPAYVLRERDRTQLRPALVAAADGPPVLVLITGESTAGKSRTAMEAARAELADWRLLVPRTPDLLAQLLDRRPNLAFTVVWVDEADEFLQQSRGAEVLERLLDLPSGPTIVLATLRTDAEDALRGTAAGRRLRYPAVRRITLHRRPPAGELAAELDRARRLDDPWIAEALTKVGDGYGLAEWLAAGPQVLTEWEQAGASERDVVRRTGAAIVAAAIDCYRAGYTTPVPERLLHEAHRLYLPVPAAAEDAVWPAALAWARAPVAGATGLLIHRPARGDRAFDYLLSHAHRTGAPAVDERLWPILARHATPATLATITASAARHGRTGLVRALEERSLAHLTYRADHGDGSAAESLAALLAGQDDVAGLTRRADLPASRALDNLLFERGDAAGLAQRAETSDGAGWLLAVLLHRRGDQAELTRRADDGDRSAAQLLARLLQERGDETGLSRRAELGDQHAAQLLAALLVERRDEAELSRRAGEGDTYAAQSLAAIRIERVDEAELALLADGGNRDAGMRLSHLLAERADEAELSRRADRGDHYAARALVGLLAARQDETALAERADRGDVNAVVELARLLADRGDTGELTRRADGGDRHAGAELARLLAAQGREDELARRAGNGDAYAPIWLAELLAGRGDETALSRRADDGDQNATLKLALLLHSRGDEAELTRRADAGDHRAARELAALLAERGDEAGLVRRADAGDDDAVLCLARLLAERGDEKALADRGDRWAARLLTDLLMARGSAGAGRPAGADSVGPGHGGRGGHPR